MATIKMQVAHGSAYLSEADQQQVDRERKAKQIHTLLREIMDSKVKTSEALYRKIVSFMLITSELGSATDIDVVREAAAALESVFPQSDLPTFVEMTTKEKEQQLTELTNIVVGIRLFNKEIGQGGAGIEEIPKQASTLSDQVCTRLDALIKIAEQQIEDYVSVITSVHRNEMHVSAPVQKLQDELNNRRQYLSYLMSLNNEAINIRNQIMDLRDQYSQRLGELKSIVKSRSAVPTDQVFPRFIAIAGLWAQVKQEYEAMKSRNSVLDALLKVEAVFKPSLVSDDVRVAKVNAETRVDVQTPEITPRPESSNLVDVILPQSNHPKFRDIPLDFKGYCPWTVVHRGGLALPGDRIHGIAVYKDMHFVFTSQRALQEFQKEPDMYFQGVIDFAKRSPELIHLLDLHKFIPDMSIVSRYMGKGRQGMHPLLAGKVTTAEAGTETPVHFVESHIDKDYTWNEWELRRRAIKLTNLRSKKTHSTQTGKSHFRRENETQHYEPKEKNQQTTSDSSTNVPVQTRYLTGIRGDADTKMQLVNLTLDLTK
eukprot:TRINITY_DN3422_c0_g1_i1.p1 TRINITY_DN3422_c0_g1~~TRINITY_DN3422_c0_g1_i1.p1  ORF type:complete len:541 (+),score=117.14 TRINITY_DN3422_c0_g1_i1:684-2306(+)